MPNFVLDSVFFLYLDIPGPVLTSLVNRSELVFAMKKKNAPRTYSPHQLSA